MISAVISGWNCTAATVSESRNACVAHASLEARSVAPAGTLSTTSRWGACTAISPFCDQEKSGSLRPSGVSCTRTVPISRPFGFRTTLEPLARPSSWCPKQTPRMGRPAAPSRRRRSPIALASVAAERALTICLMRVRRREFMETAKPRAAQIESLREEFKRLGIRTVKIGGFDVDGILRGKYVSLDKFFSVAEGGLGFCDVIFGWDSGDQLYDNAQVTGWHIGHPDMRDTEIGKVTCRV